MKRRILALAMCILMVLTVAAGCGQKENTAATESTAKATEAATTKVAEEPKQPEPVTISVGNWPRENDPDNRKAWDGYVQNLQKKYPYITIKPDQWEYDVNTFLPKAASGQLPTVYGAFFTEPQKMISAGYAADVTKNLQELGWDKALNPSFLKIVSKDDKYYGVPKEGYAMGIIYNVKLMKQAGLVDDKGVPKFPQTYDELAEMAKTIKDKTGKKGLFFPAKNNQGGWQFMNIAWSYGAEFEKQVDGKWTAVFNSPEAVAALQYLKDLKWKYGVLQDTVISDNNDLFKLLGTDQIAMGFGSHWWKNDFVVSYKMSKDDLAMSSMPGGPKSRTALAGGSAYMFAPNATPEQLDAAFKWLVETGFSPNADPAALTGLENSQKADAEAVPARPVGPHGVRVWVNPDRVAAEDEIYKKYTNVNMELWNDFVNNADKITRPEEPMVCQDLYKTLEGVIQTVLTKQDADPKALLDKACADFQKNFLDKLNK